MVFVQNKVGYEATFDSTSGLIGVWSRAKAEQIRSLAKVQVGKKTGLLQGSIRVSHRKNRNPGLRGHTLTIESEVPYAYLHHEGTKPHVIRPNTQRVLRFRASGRTIFTERVFHPGTQPNRYLSDQLRKVF
jgi:hypothetical protein